MGRWTLRLALSTLVGCSCSGETEVETEADPEEMPAEPEAANPHGEPPPEREEPALATVVSGWDRGRSVDTETLEVAADGEPLVLDLRDGARITLEPGSRAAVGEEAPAQVYLAQGALHAQLPPMGGSSRPELRVGTPAGTLVIAASGESYVMVAPDGRALFAQLAGMGRVYEGELDDEGRPAAVSLRPGRSVVGGAADATAGVGNVAAARALRSGFLTGGGEEPPAGALDERVGWLSAFLGTVAEERSRGHEIQRQRVVASQEGNAERGAELQRELIAHSQIVSRQRAALRARWERVRALALLTEPETNPAEAVRPRVRTLLGLEIPSAEPAEAEGSASDQN